MQHFGHENDKKLHYLLQEYLRDLIKIITGH